jgi:hypothetical protein
VSRREAGYFVSAFDSVFAALLPLDDDDPPDSDPDDDPSAFAAEDAALPLPESVDDFLA